MFWYHFFECSFQLIRIGGSSEFVGMMDAMDDEFFIHPYCEDGIAFLEFFIPTIVRISIGKDELFSHAVAATKDNCAMFPVYARVVAFKPVVSEVDVLLSKVRDREVDALAVLSNCHREFYELGDVPALVAGSVGVIDRDGDERLLRVKVMFFNVCLIDGASCTATVNQGFRA